LQIGTREINSRGAEQEQGCRRQFSVYCSQESKIKNRVVQRKMSKPIRKNGYLFSGFFRK
jgi:hypothetical protein